MMKVYSHKDPAVKLFMENISRYTRQAEMLNMPYWVFVQDSNPTGFVAVGKEPVKLLSSPGTPMAIVQLIDMRQSKENIEIFAVEALRLATQQNIEYASAVFPFEEAEAIGQFEKLGFKGFDDCYRMVCRLDKDFKPSQELQFKQVQREEMRQFIKLAKEFLQGSPDVSLTKALEHFLELPDDFLNFYYSQERFYFVNKDQETVGILNINANNGLVSNIGVSPQQRGKGHGRQIMLFALEQLKKSGCKQSYLRVHVENRPAINLYESLGYVKADRYRTLIWRKSAD